jgi:chorismate mutase
MNSVINNLITIAGPCSAESPEQLDQTVGQLVSQGIRTIRAGVWKPRTRPNQFEGKGEEALKWLQELKGKYDIKTTTEVASAQHVDLALKYDIDILWIGARTTVNPFGVQEIADAIRGTSIPVMIKNPINPDLSLWMGAIERINGAGIDQISAIHRGFSSFQETRFRNPPMWQIPIELKANLGHIPLICDPSHIAGNRTMLFEVCQKALDLNYDGLMIETHNNPDQALSDAQQQITPDVLSDLLSKLRIRKASSTDITFINQLDELRDKVDHVDREIIEMIAARMKMVEQIGNYKRDNNVTILQMERWKQITESRPEWGNILDLNPDLVLDIYKLIHQESIKQQTNIFNNTSDSTLK